MPRAAGTGRTDIAAVAVALAAVAMIAGPVAAAGAARSPRPQLALKEPTQASLVGGGEASATATYRGRGSKRMTLSLAVLQGGEKTNIAANRKARVRGGRKARITFTINRAGEPLVRSCLATKVRLTGRYSARGEPRRVVATRRMKRDPARCDGTDPVGVEVATADRCDPIAAPGEQCLFPYPNDFYTRRDESAPTGLRLDLKPASMPSNASGVPVDPTEINTSDGFSPGAPIVLRVPGMDTPAAFAATDPVAITDMDESYDPRQPVVVIDADTGQRQLIWTELDSNATSPDQTDLLIDFGRNLEDGHRYIVALRGMRDAAGDPIEAPAGFRLYRDRIPTGIEAIERRRDHFESIFDTLAGAGIRRHGLYLAWDFTVASTENVTGRMLSMRDQAFADLGDADLTDGGVDGDAPQFTINPNDGDLGNTDPGDDDPNGDGPNGVIDFPDATTPNDRGAENVREVTGTVRVPCYMTDPDGGGPAKPCDPGAILNLDGDGTPRQNGFYDARFTCNIPRSAVDAGGNVIAPVRTSMYGHGLFGDYTEVHTRDVRTLGFDHGVMTCATDWIGMSEDDVGPVAVPALLDLSDFKPLPDRLQQ
ncbi:MAG: hypothetical protein KJ006_07390, partial [Thermoleophilia bacterium]|nr:hypothetical protein [Thermoleophilia bacterium]